MTDVDRRGAGSIAAATAAAAKTGAPRARGRDGIRDLEAPPIGAAGSTDRRKPEWPKLDPECPAHAAARQLLAALGETLWAQERAIGDGEDAEAVHDMRVAVRRARTLLGQLSGVFPRAPTKQLRDGLRWLGEISGPARDLDILIEGVRDAQRKLPPEDRASLEALLLMLARERAGARQDLLDGLKSPRHARLVDAFERFTTPPRRSRRAAASSGKRRGDETVAASMPIAVIAAESIERAWRRLLRHGQAIDDGSPPEAVHQVRIDGKKLRYLLELFRSLFPDDAGAILAALRALQETLGTIQDQEVQVAALATLGEEMGGPPATLLAMGALAAELLLRQRAARGELAVRFAAFDARPLRRIAKRLFREPVDRAAA
jgi:CHAD domain-containing protein